MICKAIDFPQPQKLFLYFPRDNVLKLDMSQKYPGITRSTTRDKRKVSNGVPKSFEVSIVNIFGVLGSSSGGLQIRWRTARTRHSTAGRQNRL
nr:hypothetical protein CFP56_52216 [Quercus suber]